MPTRESAQQRAAYRTRRQLNRVGDELHMARMAAGMSTRAVGALAGTSHTEVLRIERASAPWVDLGVLARIAAILGYELNLSIHPAGPPVRDKAHIALLSRFAARLHPSI